MAIRIVAQKDYLLTEVSIDPTSCTPAELDDLLKITGATGKIVSLYTQGHVSGVNVEQKTKIRDSVVDQVRTLVGVETREINGHEE
jgi:hypothetical protein